MVKTKRLVAVALAILMILGSFSMTSFAWNARSNDGFDLTIHTEILRQVNGEWVKTDKVERGETVKARVYLGTDYYTNSGTLLFFYSNNFFTDNYGTGKNTLVVNPYYSSSYGIEGNFYAPASAPAKGVEALMLTDGRITEQQANEYDPINIAYSFGSAVKNKKLDVTKWFCEFDLTVKEDAPAGEFGRFLAFEATAASPTYQDGYIDIPKGSYDGYVESISYMFQWEANLIFDNDPVELYQNLVAVTFNANGGEFDDGSSTKYFEGEAGSALTVEEPTCFGYEFAGWLAAGESGEGADITAYPTADTTYTAVWKDSSGTVSETLGFRTEIHRLNEETGEYEKTERVKRGETVKARLFVDTSYLTNAGDIIVFYENDFFTDAYPTDSPVDIVANPSETSSADETGTYGKFTKVSANSEVIKQLIGGGYITDAFVKANNAFTVAYKFEPDKCATLSGDEWFIEFELQVLNSAEDWGNFYIVEDTLQKIGSDDAFINVPYGEEGWTSKQTRPMYVWDVLADIESNPVTVESTITLEGEGGTFAETGEGAYVIDSEDGIFIGDAVTAPADPERDGYAFLGWIDENGDEAEIPATMPLEDLTLYATWSEKTEITFVFNNGDPDLVQEVTSGQPFEAPEDPVKEGYQFIGWDSDDNPTTITGLPNEYPAEDTVYNAVFETVNYPVYYYVLNPVDLQFDLVTTGTCEFGNAINLVPVSYTVPEGYTLSPAYKDITFSTLFADGETMPAKRVDLYYKLTVNTYDAIFDADGGVFEDGTDTQTVPTVYGEQIVVPSNPTKEGYDFAGWSPSVETMDGEGKEFIATWEAATYYAKYTVDGATYENFPTKFGEEVDVPEDPYKDGYTFTGWSPEVDKTMPAHDTEYIAVFEANEYDAIFKLEEDDEEAYDTIPADYDAPITVPETDPEKEGYVFGGWVDENGNPPTTMDEEGKTFYAVWNPATDTKYVIETYTMNTDGTYNNAPDGTVEKTGTTGAVAEVTPNAGEGKKVDEERSVLKAEILPDGSTVLKVYYAREKVTVVFDGNEGLIPTTNEDGEAVKVEDLTLELYYGATVKAPSDPELTGYTFKGWDPAVVNKAIEDATYVAQWTVNQYTISFDTDGGNEIADITKDFNADITAPADPTKTGYTFDGWVDAEGNEAEVPAKMPAEDTVLTATWTPNTYDATFDADGGEWADGSTEQKVPAVFDTPVTEPAEDPTKDGYEFGGWVDENGNPPTSMDAEGKDFTANWIPVDQDVPVEIYFMDTDGTYPETADDTDSVKFKTEETATYAPTDVKNYTVDADKSVLEAVVAADGSTVLKVYYALNKTTISFNVDGTVTEVEGLVGADVPAEEVPAPEKDGYTFEGWEDADGNVSKDAPATFPEANETLTVKWTANKYNVTFIVDGVTVEGYPKEVEFGSTIPVAANPSKGGYIFLGWIDDAFKTPADYGTMPSTDLEFTAQWSSESGIGYVLEVYKMDTNGEYSATPSETLNFSDGVVGEVKNVTYTAPEGFVLDNSKSVLTGTIPATGTLVLKAYLERNQYTLTVDVDGVKTETEYYYGEAVDTVADPEKDGNVVFAGWADAEGNEASIPAIMPAEDVYVKATWTTSAVFNAGEGTFSDGKSEKDIPVEVGGAITAPAEEPTRDGYDFVGWGTEDDPKTPVTDFGTMDEDGESFVAIWKESTYEIIFMDKKAPDNGPAAPTVPVEIARSEIKYNGTVTLPDDPTFLDGTTYEFAGWFDAEGKEYKEGDIYEGTEDLVLYAKYNRIAVKLVPVEGSTTVVERNGVRESYNDGTDRDGAAYTPVNGVPYEAESFDGYFIYGLKCKLKETVLLRDYITVLGDGRIEVIHASPNYVPYTGTGTVINVYDRLGTEETTDDILVETFYLVIFGDVNGDSAANSADSSIINDEALGLTSWSSKRSPDYSACMAMAADVDYNTKVRSADSTLVENYALGIARIDHVKGIVTGF